MAQEFTQSTFYDHSIYSNVYYAAQIPLEFYLADVLMRSDLSRVQWSSDAYAFRRRFELADVQNGGDFESLQPTSLKLPFVNYWYENGKFWEPDDRPFSVNSQQMLKGQWQDGMPARLYAIAVKTPMVATVYYDSDQDARLAYELLMWERQPKGPIQLTSSVKWKDVDLQIPVFVTFEDVTFNPKFNETDWLKQQRMFPLQMRFTVRTYIIYFPRQTPIAGVDLSDDRLMPPYGTGARTGSLPGRDEQIYITEQVLLDFCAKKQWGSLSTAEPFIMGSDTNALQVDAIDSADGVDTVLYTTDTVSDTVVDITTGYFAPAEELYINECSVDPTSITIDSFKLKWVIRKSELKYLQDVTIMVPGQVPIKITDETIKNQVVTGLQPNSQYGVTVLFHSTNGGVRDFHLSVTTAIDPANPTPLRRKKGKLKGMEW